MPALSRRRFVSLLGLGALLAALPLMKAQKTVGVTGHLKHIAGNDYLFSAERHHCDYCYAGPAGSVWKLTSAAPLQTGTHVSLRGKISGNTFICAVV